MDPTSTRISSADRRRVALVFLGFLAAMAVSGLTAVSAEEGAKPTRIGTDACLVCHSDRPEMATFSHRARADEVGGCEACHGAGSAHAKAHGDPALILNPRKAEPARADKACLLCHAEKAAPNHKPREPGKERCADCHTIHPPAAPAAKAPEAEPGRPAFRLDLGKAVPAPAAARAFPMDVLPPLPEDATAAEGWRMGGDVRFGWRLTNVTGNDEVYDQDVNLDKGPRIFDLSFDARSPSPDGSRLSLSADGIGDPLRTYDLVFQFDQLFEFKLDATQSHREYRASGDPRDMASDRERIGGTFTLFPRADLRFTAGVDFESRDGQWRASRLVPPGVPEDREPFDEESVFFFGRVEYHADRFTGSFTQGFRTDDLDSRIRTLPWGGPDWLYDESTDADGPVSTFLAAYDASDTLKLDGKFVYSGVSSDTDGHGTLDDVSETTESYETVSGDRTYLRGEIGATWFATEEFSFAGRAAGSSDDTDVDGRLEEHVTGGGPPVFSSEESSFERDQDRLRLTAEGDYRPATYAAFRLGYEWLWDDYEESQDGYDDGDEFDHSEDTSAQGILAGVDLDPTDDLSIEGLYRFVMVDEPFAAIGTEDEDQERVKVRYKGIEDVDLSAFLSHRLSTNRLHDTEIFAWVTGVSAGYEASEDLTLTATFDWQTFDTQTDAVRFYDTDAYAGRAEYDGQSTGLTLDLGFKPLAELLLHAGTSLYLVRGDYQYDWYQFWLGGAYELSKSVTIGADARLTIYDDHELSMDDYKGWVLEIWLRFGF